MFCHDLTAIFLLLPFLENLQITTTTAAATADAGADAGALTPKATILFRAKACTKLTRKGSIQKPATPSLELHITKMKPRRWSVTYQHETVYYSMY